VRAAAAETLGEASAADRDQLARALVAEPRAAGLELRTGGANLGN
jgi:hypothetical protein